MTTNNFEKESAQFGEALKAAIDMVRPHNDSEYACRLEELYEEITDKVQEVREIVMYLSRGGATAHVAARAKAYWLAQITTALSSNHDYLGGCMCTMEDTINELNASLEGDDDDE